MRIVIQPSLDAIPSGPPPRDELHLWVVDFAALGGGPGALGEALPPDERDRAARYRAGEVRDQFVACRGALRRLLGGCLGVPPYAVPIVYAANGKPVLADPVVHFNVSHTHGLGLLAVGPVRVGVDVERERDVPDTDGLVERFFSPAERGQFRGLPPGRRHDAFYRGWVCKEALIKAAGASVQYLDRFDVELDPGARPALLGARHPTLTGRSWSLVEWAPRPGFRAAVAVEAVGPLGFDPGPTKTPAG